ncbi:MAG: 3-phosphoserine/phosphohydroxythreonine transaminase [Kiritimatiellae bacterium]|nr:3-phosphoserine/phosphohydroxythreonine transaminase [Kiritimatiellia bacterium]
MARIFNFAAGPSTLPLPVLEKIQQEIVDYQGAGFSLIEASHRGPHYSEVHAAATAGLRKLLGLPENYHVLWLQGGATLQFSMVPLNLLAGGKPADYTLTGTWAKKAVADAKKIGKVNLVFDGTEAKFMTLPRASEVKASAGAVFLHLTSNETIGGVQWQEWPAVDVPLVCDMSSDFLSRRIPLEKFGLIYAGAQKNLGPAGLAVVIIRDDVLARCSDDLTAYLSYKIHAAGDSLYNTPPVFPIWVSRLVLDYLNGKGGLPWVEKLAEDRSRLLYGMMDKHPDFYRCPVAAHCRSKMNVVWRLPSEDLEKQFIAEAKKAGMDGLKGHRSVGGCRASIYNAMPLEGAQTLAGFMDEFARKHG